MTRLAARPYFTKIVKLQFVVALRKKRTENVFDSELISENAANVDFLMIFTPKEILIVGKSMFNK